jgi:hypothetical protein
MITTLSQTIRAKITTFANIIFPERNLIILMWVLPQNKHTTDSTAQASTRDCAAVNHAWPSSAGMAPSKAQ